MYVNIDNPVFYNIFMRKIKQDYTKAYKFYCTNKKNHIIDIPMSIDIETTDTGEICFPYVYMIGFNNICYATRYKDTFIKVIESINNIIDDIDNDLNLIQICFIHNLNYELTFFNGYFEDISVFATDKNKALFVDIGKIKILDTMRLANMSLYKLGKNFNLHHGKLKGGLDYSKYRDSTVKLSAIEKEYCANDVILLNEYWNVYKKFAVTGKKLFRIILTSTGITRQKLESNVNNRQETKEIVKKINVYDDDKIKDLLIETYTGAFVKSNLHLTRKVLTNIDMWDYTSSYIGVMFEYKYPIEQFKKSDDKLNYILSHTNDYAYLIDIQFESIKAKYGFSTISYHKLKAVSGEILDNGRILQAEKIRLSVTETDLIDILNFYDIKRYNIVYQCKAKKGYLPKYLLNTVVQLYSEKQDLKYMINRDEQMYLLSKGKLNSCYGMMVTKPHSINYVYDKTTGEYITQVNNKYEKTYLCRQWGNYVTCYARHNLLSTIKKIESYKEDSVIYTDTDSIKVRYADTEIFNIIKCDNNYYNDLIKKSCVVTGIDFEKIKGIGLWDYEGHVDKFITMGSKKYGYCKNDKWNVTISGINKQRFIYYCNINNIDIESALLSDNLIIPKEYTNKNACEYNILPDFVQLNPNQNPTKGFVKLKPVDFTYKIKDTYDILLAMYNNIEYMEVE